MHLNKQKWQQRKQYRVSSIGGDKCCIPVWFSVHILWRQTSGKMGHPNVLWYWCTLLYGFFLGRNSMKLLSPNMPPQSPQHIHLAISRRDNHHIGWHITNLHAQVSSIRQQRLWLKICDSFNKLFSTGARDMSGFHAKKWFGEDQ